MQKHKDFIKSVIEELNLYSKSNSIRETYYRAMKTLRSIEKINCSQPNIEELRSYVTYAKESMVISEYTQYFTNEIKTGRINLENFENITAVERSKISTVEGKKIFEQEYKSLSLIYERINNLMNRE